ncbi:MAG: RNA polymerase subunit sigma [Bacteroidetes bacterium HGW-Bacteroidetes-4]|jgi:RNA polymerase sigma-70 factor (ECF subfamily)|nr:MAG: RNA polymerase subunit sigma [Bacteroidetes bacterium HGW-Bacteroidetes-4]
MNQSNPINLTEWVNSYTNELYSWAFHKVSDVELAKDLVQDTFLAASEKISNFQGESSPKTWLFAILNHKIIDVYRKKVNKPVNLEFDSYSKFFNPDGGWKKGKQPDDWEEDETHLLDDADFHLILKKCLDALPEKWNTCVKLKYLAEKNGDEICQELNMTTTNYWQIIHRAKLQLRDCIDNNWFKK